MSTRNSIRTGSPRRQKGLSLVELMVALTIGLFLVGAVAIIYANTATTSRGSTLEAQMNEDAAVALELLQQQVRLAGFSNVTAGGARRFPGRAIRGCDGGFTNNANGTPFEAQTCGTVPAAGAPDADAFAVRYEATSLNSQSVVTGGVPLPANCANEGIASWNALTAGEGAAVDGIALADNRYYIANDVDGTPSLFCQGRVGGPGAGPAGTGFGAATALIPNIEDMVVEYAVTALPAAGNPIPHQVAGYVDAQNAVLGSAAPINWSRVAALRICLLVRSAHPVPTGDNTSAVMGRYTDCRGVVQTRNDRFVRQAYATTVQLRNVRPSLPADFVAGNNPYAYLYEN